MSKTIIVTESFKFAHDGIRVEEFTASPVEIETTDECADEALREGWAELPGAPGRVRRRNAVSKAPANKAELDPQEPQQEERTAIDTAADEVISPAIASGEQAEFPADPA